MNEQQTADSKGMPPDACAQRIREVEGLVKDIERVLASWTGDEPEFLRALRVRRDQLGIELSNLQDQQNTLDQATAVEDCPPPEPLGLDRAPTQTSQSAQPPIVDWRAVRTDEAPEPDRMTPALALDTAVSIHNGAAIHYQEAGGYHLTYPPVPNDRSGTSAARSLAVVGVAAFVPGLLALLLVWSMLTGESQAPGAAFVPLAQPAEGVRLARGEPQPAGISPTTTSTQIAALASLNGSDQEPNGSAAAPLVLDDEGLLEDTADPSFDLVADEPTSQDDTLAWPLDDEEVEGDSAPALAYARIQPPVGYRAASIHARPSTAAGIVAMVPRDGMVIVLDETAVGGGYRWRRIRTLDDIEGWIITAALRP